MKLSLLFVAILGVATVTAVPTGKALNRSTKSLTDDWADFLALVDTDAVVEVVVQYLAEDAEVQNLVVYVLSEDFSRLVLAVEALPEYIAFLDYLQAAGLDVYKYINIIHGILGLPDLRLSTKSLSVSRLVSTRITGGIAGLWTDLKAVLPLAEARALFEEKLQTSEEFAALITLLSSDKAQTIYDALKANEEYQHIRETLVAAGLNVDTIFDVLKSLIGWE